MSSTSYQRPLGSRDAVAVWLTRADGRALVVRRAEHQPAGGFWTTVTGKIEPGETPEEAVVRELLEEVGLATVCAEEVYATPTNDGVWWLRWFRATLADAAEADNITLAVRELSECRWIDATQVDELSPIHEPTHKALTSLFAAELRT